MAPWQLLVMRGQALQALLVQQRTVLQAAMLLKSTVKRLLAQPSYVHQDVMNAHDSKKQVLADKRLSVPG